MPASSFSSETVLIFLQLVREKSNILFSKVNNKLTVNNKYTAWKDLCGDLVRTTGDDGITVDKLIKKWDNLKSKLRNYVAKMNKCRSATGGGQPPVKNPILELCWDIMGRDNPGLTKIPGASQSSINASSESVSDNVSNPIQYNVKETGHRNAQETQMLDQSVDQTFMNSSRTIDAVPEICTSATVAKLACRKLEEEIHHNRIEHQLKMELLTAKREYYVEKTARLMSSNH